MTHSGTCGRNLASALDLASSPRQTPQQEQLASSLQVSLCVYAWHVRAEDGRVWCVGRLSAVVRWVLADVCQSKEQQPIKIQINSRRPPTPPPTRSPRAASAGFYPLWPVASRRAASWFNSAVHSAVWRAAAGGTRVVTTGAGARSPRSCHTRVSPARQYGVPVQAAEGQGQGRWQ